MTVLYVLFCYEHTADTDPELYKDVTILCTLSSLPSDPAKAPYLRLVHLFSAGSNQVQNHPIWTDTNIPITSSSGVHPPQIAEWVIMQILSHSHKEKLLIQWQKEHKWGSHQEIGTVKDCVGQRLGVLGYGSIGRQAARVSKALGMDIIAYTASPRKTPASKKDRGYIVPNTGDPDGLLPSEWYSGLDKASLHNFLKQDIDILLVAVPLTATTLHFLGEEEFAILAKKRAQIINIARGSIIVTADLIAALNKGDLRGAALDVTDPEPLDKDSELWDLENVAVTPHVSGIGTQYVDRSFDILERNITNLETGLPLLNEVDRKKGY